MAYEIDVTSVLYTAESRQNVGDRCVPWPWAVGLQQKYCKHSYCFVSLE